jgi:aminocarboxymuconate-semialdehyde decarboxylase
MKVIDVHNHFYPGEYVKAIEAGPSAYRVTYDDDNNPVLHSPGDYNILVPAHRSVDIRKSVLEEKKVDKQVISFTCPGTLIETPERSTGLSKIVNDNLASVQDENSDYFASMGTLPLNDPDSCAAELERIITSLKLKGVALYSNANGVSLSDVRFWPMYEVANEHEVVFFIHPTFPLGVEAMKEYMLMPLVGFLADTTLAAAHLVFSGVAARFPKIKWLLGHLGGAVPYLAERFDRGYEAYPQNRKNINRPPSEYLKEFYYDTVNFDLNALRLALDFAGPGHLLAGSDYPHQIGSLDKMVSSIKSLDIPEDQKEAILGGNAARLFRLE